MESSDVHVLLSAVPTSARPGASVHNALCLTHPNQFLGSASYILTTDADVKFKTKDVKALLLLLSRYVWTLLSAAIDFMPEIRASRLSAVERIPWVLVLCTGTRFLIMLLATGSKKPQSMCLGTFIRHTSR